ncbi:MAG: hypothetical protein WD512_13235 [Candidatus Paceibacterota bacterium]
MPKKKEEIEKKFERRSIGKELCEILDNEKEKINHYAWDSLKISDVEASRVIAKKYLKHGLEKETITDT